MKLVHERHWTIPVAYDSTAAVAQLYGVTVCPMIEVARRGGIVSRLLIGDRWEQAPALTVVLSHVLSERQ